MVKALIKKLILILLLVSLMSALEVAADRVVLKDGTVEESIRVWETDRYVHFILKGTQSVEIRYAKEIVDHIERTDGSTHAVIAKVDDVGRGSASTPPTPPVSALSGQASAPTALGSSPTPGGPPQAPSSQLDRSFIARNRNLSFYDPRRPQRYWADSQSKHAHYQEAIAVLAAQYGRSANWVEKHMGQDNDLGGIHANLIAAVEAEMAPVLNQASVDQHPVMPPGEAASPNPVEPQNVQEEQPPAQPPTLEHPVLKESATPPVKAIPPGIPFYDPRRPEKFWATPEVHCTSLQEAVQSLAKIYGAPVAQIESNLGESNDLSQIHANIQQSLGLVQK